MDDAFNIGPYRWVREGFLVTLQDGHKCVLRNDQSYAADYAAKNHAICEPLYVMRYAHLGQEPTHAGAIQQD